jgi:hypothetical protein
MGVTEDVDGVNAQRIERGHQVGSHRLGGMRRREVFALAMPAQIRHDHAG